MKSTALTAVTIEEKEIILLVALGLFALTLFIFFISLLIFRRREGRYRRTLGDLSNSLRVYVLDVRADRVRYFNRSSLRRQKVSSMMDFYNQFPAPERERLISWIHDLIHAPSATDRSLEIDVLFSHDRRSYFSVLQAQKVDAEKEVIHLESYILPYISAKRHRRNSLSFLSKEAFDKALLALSPLKGVTFVLSFFGRKKRYEGEGFPSVIFAQVKDVLTNFLTPSRLMYEESNHEIVITDLKATARARALQVITSIREAVNRQLLLSAYAAEIAFTIGVIENRHFPLEPTKLIVNAAYVAGLAREEGGAQVLWYEKGMNPALPGDYTYRTEVERIIRDRKLTYSYRLIYDAERLRPFGYLSFAVPTGTVFETLAELKDYAQRTGDDRALFGTIAKNLIATFIAESYDQDLRLFFFIRFSEKADVMRTLSHMARIRETRVVLVLDERDLSDIVMSRDEIIVRDVRSLKVKGYETALVLDDSELTLTPRVYELFDYFILQGHLTSNVQNDARARLRIHGLIEKLLPYGKRIIASDLVNWADVELLIKLGVGLISSEVLAPQNALVIPIASKSENKIKALRPSGERHG